MRGRPNLFTRYEADGAIFPNNAQRIWFIVGLIAVAILPIWLPRDWMILIATAFIASVGVIGLNLITGYAGQVSLGHAFFLGIGCYAGAAFGGIATDKLTGFGFDILIWLPAAGLTAGLIGAIIAPIAVRLKGLYLAFLTLGLVFVGEHVFREWDSITGGPGIGREPAQLNFLGWRFDVDGNIGGIDFTREQQIYWLGLVVLIIMGFLAKNIVRSRIGRAFAAIRDRDIAAEVMGIGLTRYKVLAFAVSSFYAGVAGALLFTVTGFVNTTSFNLLLSINYIAMVVIGGAASIAGSIMGAAFLTLLPRMIDAAGDVLPFLEVGSQGILSTSQLERIIFGALIIGFLIFEPMGLFGIWIRVRNYWKAWPFSY
ncbi:MAG: branched-chain amino acid ABC transporter permease [Acidimicrobiia bacterium]|nr:branched-chain amino acid ABC transporter permease [Acidimicrobiia bacterium]